LSSSAPTGPITILPIPGIPEIQPGDELTRLIVDAAQLCGSPLQDGDVLVVTQKVVSKAEGRLVDVPSGDKQARWRLAEQEAVRVLRRTSQILITQTRHGFVCASSGIDNSNVAEGKVALLPLDPDLSARRIRSKVAHLCGKDIAVVISDTFGRAWRNGQTDVAIGVAGMEPLIDYRGTTDTFGQTLAVTSIAIADELAGAAEMVMGKADQVAAAIVRGARFQKGDGTARELVREVSDDLFR